MPGQSIASAYAQAVLQHPELPHAAVRLGLWLAAVAEQQGGFPVTIAPSKILSKGIENRKVLAPPIQFRYETVIKSIDTLRDAGLLRAEQNDERQINFTLTLAEAVHG